MKKKIFGILMALVLALSLTTPAFAFSEYGLIYDASDLLDAQTAQQASDVLSDLTNTFEVEFRVDVVTSLEDMEIYDYAELFYEQYEYGYGASLNGILLMLHLVPDDDGLSLSNVQLYCGGADAVYLWDFGDVMDTYAGAYLTDEAWSGPLDSDNRTFADLMAAYTEAAQDFFSGDTEIEPGASATEYTSVGAGLLEISSYITDEAGILTDNERATLETRAAELSKTYNCGLYVVTVENFLNYDYNLESLCKSLHKNCALGYGDDGEAIMLLLSMKDRDYWLIDFGDTTAASITDYGHEMLKSAFLDDFSSNDWNDGFSDYLEQSAIVLDAAKNGEPLDQPLSERAPKAYGIALVVGLIGALVTCSIFKAQMKTAVMAASAEEYVAPSGVDIRIREDRYTHTSQTRRRIEKKSSSGGGNHSSGGKF